MSFDISLCKHGNPAVACLLCQYPMPDARLQDNGFIVPAAIMAEVENELLNEAELKLKGAISIPAKYWPGTSYTAPVGESAPDLDPAQLETIPVGIQEHAVDFKGSSPINGEAMQVAIAVQKQSAHSVAIHAQKKRVSRRLLLAERSKKLTVVCPITGIVSLIEYPAIPYKTLVYSHPLSDLANCRGIAQQGLDYLRRLDTQTLAGILIVLADDYELFTFQPFDSGAQKNAIIRTAGKDHIIEAIIMIEDLIHSGNAKYLPKLSIRFDRITEEHGLLYRMQNYLKELADAIAKPDKEAYDPNAIKKVGRPVYIKDIEKKERKISFLARQEIARAKKQYAEDRKAGKAAISDLCKTAAVTEKLRALLLQLMAENALLSIPSIWVEKICERLEQYNNAPAKTLLEILKRDRKALLLDVSELEEAIEKEQEDDPAPGNEEAIEESETVDDLSADQMETNGSSAGNHMDLDTSALRLDAAPELVPPEGLSTIEKILWKKKMQAAKARNIVQNDLPSSASYSPSVTKENLGKDQK